MIIVARILPELLVTLGWRGLCEDVLCLAAQISLGCVSAGGQAEMGRYDMHTKLFEIHMIKSLYALLSNLNTMHDILPKLIKPKYQCIF